MKTSSRMSDLMILGQLVLLAGTLISVLNLNDHSTFILQQHVEWGLLIISALLMLITSYDALRNAEPKTNKLRIVYATSLGSVMGFLFLVSNIASHATFTWLMFALLGPIVTLIYHKEFTSMHCMVWAWAIVMGMVGLKKLPFDDNVSWETAGLTILVMTCISCLGFIIGFLGKKKG